MSASELPKREQFERHLRVGLLRVLEMTGPEELFPGTSDRTTVNDLVGIALSAYDRTPEALPSNNGSKLADSTDANGSAKPGPTPPPPDGIGELGIRANARVFGKTYKQEIAFKEACDRGETVEYHGANWVAMSRAQYNRLTTQPEEKPKVADSPGLGKLEVLWCRHSQPIHPYRSLASCPDYTQPGAGTTLPTEHQADAATGEDDTADDNAAPPAAHIKARLGYLIADANPDYIATVVEDLQALITADRTRLKQELLERVGEDEGWKHLNIGEGPTLEDFKKYVAARNELRQELRAALEAVFGGGE